MGRKRRIQEPNLTYHVYSRCAQGLNLMEDKYWKERMMVILDEAREKFHFKLNNFEILHNHFHFLITTLPGGAKISKIMQTVKSRFAREYNKKTGRFGPFWNERYGDTIIQDSENPIESFIRVNWYLAYNAVRAKLTDDPRNYPYGGINYYLDPNYKGPLKVDIHAYFEYLGSVFKERVEVLKEYEIRYRQMLGLPVH